MSEFSAFLFRIETITHSLLTGHKDSGGELIVVAVPNRRYTFLLQYNDNTVRF